MVNPEQQAMMAQQAAEQRFRGSLVSSATLHTLALLVAIFGRGLLPQRTIMPSVTPVRLVSLPAAQPPAPEPVVVEPEEQPPPEEPAPEEPEAVPVPAVTSEPEPVPRTIRDLQRERREAEEQAVRDEEAARRRAEEERRRRAAEEEERRQREEEERRRQPQKAGRREPPPPQNQSARRTAIDLTGTDEAQTSFTVEDFPFAAYLLRIRDMVADRWAPPERGPYAAPYRAEVFFRIGRDGQLVVTPRVFSTSENAIFDQAALRAIASAAPFPPLPRNYQGQSLGVRFAFVQE